MRFKQLYIQFHVYSLGNDDGFLFFKPTWKPLKPCSSCTTSLNLLCHMRRSTPNTCHSCHSLQQAEPPSWMILEICSWVMSDSHAFRKMLGESHSCRHANWHQHKVRWHFFTKKNPKTYVVSLRKLTSTLIGLEVLEEMMMILVKAASLIIRLLGFLCD